MILRSQKSILVLLGLLTLSGCDKTKEIFGMKRLQPDEFTILSRPPLSAPPGIGLKPPLPEGVGVGPLDKSPESQARDTLLGDSGTTSEANRASLERTSEGENALLSQSQAGDADHTIRAKLVHDQAEKTAEGGAPLQDVLYWQEKKEAGKVIDAHQEYEQHHETVHPSK